MQVFAISLSFCFNEFQTKSLLLYLPCSKRCLCHLCGFSCLGRGNPTSPTRQEIFFFSWLFGFFFSIFSFIAHEIYSPFEVKSCKCFQLALQCKEKVADPAMCAGGAVYLPCSFLPTNIIRSPNIPLNSAYTEPANRNAQ